MTLFKFKITGGSPGPGVLAVVARTQLQAEAFAHEALDTINETCEYAHYTLQGLIQDPEPWTGLGVAYIDLGER